MSSEQATPAPHQAWEQALSAIEQGLDGIQAEQDDAIATFLSWRAPDDIGPIPPDMEGRARNCTRRIAELIGQTATQMDGVRRQQAATAELVSATQQPARAVYLDTTA